MVRKILIKNRVNMRKKIYKLFLYPFIVLDRFLGYDSSTQYAASNWHN